LDYRAGVFASGVTGAAARVVYELFARHLPSYFSWTTRLRVRLASAFIESAHPTSVINEGVRLSRHVALSERAGIGARSEFHGVGRVSIGRNVMMGSQCLFITVDHPVPRDGEHFSALPPTTQSIYIEEDVFLGARVTVLPGVTIGRGAAVGAGAVVAKDVPPGATVVGVPARVVSTRRPPPSGS